MKTIKLGGSEYPEEVVKAFTESLPYSAKRLEDFLTGVTNNPKGKQLLDVYYAGWLAAMKAMSKLVKGEN